MPMAKFKILKTGETDIESTDIWRFCVNSDYPTQKIYAAGEETLTIPAGDNQGIRTINHSLGYPPIVMAMFEISGGRFVKVFGGTKGRFTSQVIQFFTVNLTTDAIVGITDDSITLGKVTDVSVNDVIRFTSGPRNGGVLPSPLVANTNYYVKSIIDAVRFTISATQGGPTINITDSGGTYGDIFENITNPYNEELALIYGVKVTDSYISFYCDPTIDAPSFKNDTGITVYYIILYDQI